MAPVLRRCKAPCDARWFRKVPDRNRPKLHVGPATGHSRAPPDTQSRLVGRSRSVRRPLTAKTGGSSPLGSANNFRALVQQIAFWCPGSVLSGRVARLGWSAEGLFGYRSYILFCIFVLPA